MTHSLSIATAGRLLRSLTGQITMSVVVSAGVAGVFALPGVLFPQKVVQVTLASAGPSEPVAWLSPVSADGKIGDRHRAAAADGIEPRRIGLMTPAALVMPMSMAWSQPAAAEPIRVAAAVPEKAARPTVAEVVPVRRPAALSERPKPVQVAIAPVAAIVPPAVVGNASADEAPAGPTLLGRVVYEPVARATTIVSSAAGIVGSAGSWTVVQATSLLPRW